MIVAGMLFLLTRHWTLRVDGITQDRLNRALPPLGDNGLVVQSLVATKPNLCAIEVLLGVARLAALVFAPAAMATAFAGTVVELRGSSGPDNRVQAHQSSE